MRTFDNRPWRQQFDLSGPRPSWRHRPPVSVITSGLSVTPDPSHPSPSASGPSPSPCISSLSSWSLWHHPSPIYKLPPLTVPVTSPTMSWPQIWDQPMTFSITPYPTKMPPRIWPWNPWSNTLKVKFESHRQVRQGQGMWAWWSVLSALFNPLNSIFITIFALSVIS